VYCLPRVSREADSGSTFPDDVAALSGMVEGASSMYARPGLWWAWALSE
jgi:hypothetical protein